MARPSYSSGGSTYTTTTSTLTVATGTRTAGDILLVGVMWRCSNAAGATITTDYANFKWITPEQVQGDNVVRWGTVKWTASENMTFTLTNGGTIDAGYGNAVFFGASNGATRWWTEWRVSKGSIPGASQPGTIAADALTVTGANADLNFFAFVMVADNAYPFDSAPVNWTTASPQSSSVGQDWARHLSYAVPASGSTSQPYSATLTTTTTIPASGTVDWIMLMGALSGEEVVLSSAATGSAAQTLPAFGQTAQGDIDVRGSAAQTLAAPAQAASGTVPVKGQGAQALAAPAQTASGRTLVQGQAAQTVPALTQSATGGGVQQTSGSAAQALTVASSAAGRVIVAGSGTQALTVSQSATGAAPVKGSAAQTIPPLSQSATGRAGAVAQGSAAQAVPAFGQSASGRVVVTGVAAHLVPAFASTGAGKVDIAGAANQPLVISSDAAGRVIVFGEAAQAFLIAHTATGRTGKGDNPEPRSLTGQDRQASLRGAGRRAILTGRARRATLAG